MAYFNLPGKSGNPKRWIVMFKQRKTTIFDGGLICVGLGQDGSSLDFSVAWLFIHQVDGLVRTPFSRNCCGKALFSPGRPLTQLPYPFSRHVHTENHSHVTQTWTGCLKSIWSAVCDKKHPVRATFFDENRINAIFSHFNYGHLLWTLSEQTFFSFGLRGKRSWLLFLPLSKETAFFDVHFKRQSDIAKVLEKT